MRLETALLPVLLVAAFIAGRFDLSASLPSEGPPDSVKETALNDLRDRLEEVRSSIEALHATAFSAAVQTAPAESECRTPRQQARREGAEDSPAQGPEQKLAVEKAIRLVDGAISTGRWTQEDEQQLQFSLVDLSERHRGELYGRLFAAMNRGEVLSEE